MIQSFSETNPRIQNDLVGRKAEIVQPVHSFNKEVLHLLDNIGITGVRLHCLGGAPQVNTNVSSAGRGKVNSNWRARRIMGESPKSEDRRPKEIRSPKSEFRAVQYNLWLCCWDSDFGFRSDFDLRISDF